MLEKLRKLIENSYSPVYKYYVAAILECTNGQTFTGVNVETSSPASGICAERNALYSAIAHGYKKEDFKAIYLMNKTVEPCFPCFICRQALVDLCPENFKIITYNYDGTKTKEVTIKELCPYPFSSEDLSWKVVLLV